MGDGTGVGGEGIGNENMESLSYLYKSNKNDKILIGNRTCNHFHDECCYKKFEKTIHKLNYNKNIYYY